MENGPLCCYVSTIDRRTSEKNFVLGFVIFGASHLDRWIFFEHGCGRLLALHAQCLDLLVHGLFVVCAYALLLSHLGRNATGDAEFCHAATIPCWRLTFGGCFLG